MAFTFDDAKAEFRLLASDRWGDCMAAWFAVAGEMYERGEGPPKEWHYSPGIKPKLNPDEDFWVPLLEEMESDELARWGAFLHRYAAMLKATGHDY